MKTSTKSIIITTGLLISHPAMAKSAEGLAWTISGIVLASPLIIATAAVAIAILGVVETFRSLVSFMEVKKQDVDLEPELDVDSDVSASNEEEISLAEVAKLENPEQPDENIEKGTGYKFHRRARDYTSEKKEWIDKQLNPILKLKIENKVDQDQENNATLTVLKQDIVNPRYKSPQGFTPLMLATHPSLITNLIKVERHIYGEFNIASHSIDGYSPLHRCVDNPEFQNAFLRFDNYHFNTDDLMQIQFDQFKYNDLTPLQYAYAKNQFHLYDTLAYQYNWLLRWNADNLSLRNKLSGFFDKYLYDRINQSDLMEDVRVTFYYEHIYSHQTNTPLSFENWYNHKVAELHNKNITETLPTDSVTELSERNYTEKDAHFIKRKKAWCTV